MQSSNMWSVLLRIWCGTSLDIASSIRCNRDTCYLPDCADFFSCQVCTLVQIHLQWFPAGRCSESQVRPKVTSKTVCTDGLSLWLLWIVFILVMLVWAAALGLQGSGDVNKSCGGILQDTEVRWYTDEMRFLDMKRTTDLLCSLDRLKSCTIHNMDI